MAGRTPKGSTMYKKKCKGRFIFKSEPSLPYCYFFNSNNDNICVRSKYNTDDNRDLFNKLLSPRTNLSM